MPTQPTQSAYKSISRGNVYLSDADRAFDRPSQGWSEYSYNGLTGRAEDNNSVINHYLQMLDQSQGTPWQQELESLWDFVFQQYKMSTEEFNQMQAGKAVPSNDWVNNHLSDISAKLNDIASRQREEQYNSVPNQAIQETLAGRNPNLTGLSNPQAGSAAEGDPLSFTPSDSFSGIQRQREIAQNFGFQAINGMLSLAGSLMGLRSSSLDNALKALNIETGSDSFILETLAGVVPAFKKDADGNLTPELDEDATAASINEALKRIDMSDIKNPSLRKAFTRAKSRWGILSDNKVPVGFAQKWYDNIYKANKSRFDLAQIFGDGRYSDDFNVMTGLMSDYYNEYTQHSLDFQHNIEELQQEYQNIMNNTAFDNHILNRAQVAEMISQGVPEAEAAARLASLQAQKYEEEFKKEEQKAWDKMINAIPGNSAWSNLARMLFGYLRNMSMQGITPQQFIPRGAPHTNSVTYHNDTTNKYGTTVINN